MISLYLPSVSPESIAHIMCLHKTKLEINYKQQQIFFKNKLKILFQIENRPCTEWCGPLQPDASSKPPGSSPLGKPEVPSDICLKL